MLFQTYLTPFVQTLSLKNNTEAWNEKRILYECFIVLCCTPKVLYNHMGGGLSSTNISTVVVIRGGTVHVFVPTRHSTDLLVRCMRPYDENRQFTPNPEGGARNNATLFDNCQRQQKNSECRELCAWKQSPLDSDHVLILNASLT